MLRFWTSSIVLSLSKNTDLLCWNEAKFFQIEPNSAYGKYKKSAHMSLIDHPISQRSLDISPIWAPVITAEVKNYNSYQCRLRGEICFSCVGTIRSMFSI
jgi:hypothetical protein